jgi:4'-phosphopantetheinyl transferase
MRRVVPARAPLAVRDELASVDPGWGPGPAQPRLSRGVVHVWRADLHAAGEEVLSWLSPEERERAARFARPRTGRLWAHARGVLRGLLARYVDAEPARLELRFDRHGKPALAARGRPPALSFNLSHSGPVALYAFSSAAAVGVDVELARLRRARSIALAARAFGADEARRLSELEPGARQAEFLRAWTRHESVLKCVGTGIGAGQSALARQAPWVAQLELGEVAYAAVAAQGAASQLCCWSFGAPAEARSGAGGAGS